jgi:hypothetical protein
MLIKPTHMQRKGLEPILSEHESDELPITQSLLYNKYQNRSG